MDEMMKEYKRKIIDKDSGKIILKHSNELNEFNLRAQRINNMFKSIEGDGNSNSNYVKEYDDNKNDNDNVKDDNIPNNNEKE